MEEKRVVKSRISLTLFIDDSVESNDALTALKAINEQFQIYHVQSLNMTKGDEIEAPTLYAPEGVFRGWKQIQTFVRIPRNMRCQPVAVRS